jgi:uncharacterized protein YjdB
MILMNIGKKLLSLLTVFCLTLSLVPTVALAADATSVTVDGTSVVGSSTTYYKNKGYTGGLKNGNANDYNVKYEPDTHTLTLNNYQGSSIYSNDYLTINVEGQDNKIKNIEYSNNAILVYDNLTITGTGRLESEASKNRSTIYVAKNLTINGGVTLIVPGGSSGQSIHAVGGSIVISDSNTVVKATSGYSQGVVRSGDINGYGTIELKDGATLTADKIDVKQNGFLVNGKVNTDETNINTTAGATYTIFGMVTNGTTPVKNALVQLCTADTVASSEPTVISYSTTETNGTYTLSKVPAGSYIIKVTKEGYNDFTTASFAVSGNVTNKNLTLTPIAPSQYTVTINAESNMTPTGSASQTVTAGQPMTSVTYTSETDFYFPENYSNIITNNITINGIVVTRTSSREITVSGIPTANTTINLTSPTPKTKPNAPSPTAIDCTTESNNDGKITGVNNTMEYKAENASDWSSISGDTIENLASGTYYVRVKATDTTFASDSTEVTVSAYVTKYQVWVNGTQVTEANKDNVLGDNSHSVTYTPATENVPAKLILTNAVINNVKERPASGPMYYIFPNGITAKEELQIIVKGTENTITSEHGCAITSNKDLTICGDGSLMLNSQNDSNALTTDYYSRTINIEESVKITATVALDQSMLQPGEPSIGMAIAAYNTNIQDAASVTAINYGTNWAVYSHNQLIVKDSAILTARSQEKGKTICHIVDSGRTITASVNFDGNPLDGTYDSGKLSTTYKYVKVEPSKTVAVTNVTLDKATLSMKVGESDTLTATVTPTNATNQAVTWTSSNEAVATVTNGTVNAVGVGTATITVTTTDGSYTASCTVTVTRASSSSGSHTTYYPVNTPAKSEGGSVVVSPKSASKGAAVTVTVTPESGYQVSSVQAVDEDGKKLTLTDKGDGKYSFVMPGSKVEVSASFAQVQKPEETSPYRDVSKDSYYYDAVQWASNKGITNGVADGVFAPDWICTRGQIVTFLWRSVGSPTPKTAEMPFADVAEDAYYAQAVLWAVENGITKGTSETTFSPDQTCTRAHAVAFLYRLVGSPAVTGSSFQDVAADAYYNAAVAWAVQQGITNGTSETTFSPDETCTRAQIVTFLYRMDQAK